MLVPEIKLGQSEPQLRYFGVVVDGVSQHCFGVGNLPLGEVNPIELVVGVQTGFVFFDDALKERLRLGRFAVNNECPRQRQRDHGVPGLGPERSTVLGKGGFHRPLGFGALSRAEESGGFQHIHIARQLPPLPSVGLPLHKPGHHLLYILDDVPHFAGTGMR